MGIADENSGVVGHDNDARDRHWLRAALELAEQARRVYEVPVGAVLVLDDQIVGQGWNKTIMTQDPSAHAEIIALRQAAQKIKNHRLLDTTLYVTLEPCSMCVGAMVHARIKRLVFGAYDLKTGAVCSCTSLLQAPFHNHRIEYVGGVLEQECATLLSDFFGELRKKKKDASN